MLFPGPPEAEQAAQGLASTQALQGLGSLAEAGTISQAGVAGAISGLLASQAAAGTALNTIGLAGPTVSPSPQAVAYNTQAAIMINTLISQLASIASAQAYLRLGTSAMLANSGRRFLLSTYYGL